MGDDEGRRHSVPIQKMRAAFEHVFVTGKQFVAEEKVPVSAAGCYGE